MKSIYWTIAILIIFMNINKAIATEKFIKKKTISKHYNTTNGDILIIRNQPGNIYIHTWKKDEITIDVTVTVTTDTEARSTFLLGRVNIDEEARQEGNHRILLATHIQRYNEENQVDHLEVNVEYVVNVPENIAMNIEETMGSVYMDDFAGKLKLHITHGAFHLKNITGADKKIEVTGHPHSSTIESIESGRVIGGGGNLSINKAQDVRLGGWDTLSVKQAGSIEIAQRSGYLNIGAVNVITGVINDAVADIGSLVSSADLDIFYCKKVTLKSIGSKDVDQINIRSDFSSIYLHFNEQGNYYVDMGIYAKTGTIIDDTWPKYLKQVYSEPYKDSEYRGYKGKVGAGGNYVTLELLHGIADVK